MSLHVAAVDLYDPVRFIRTHLVDKLNFTPQTTPIAVHVTCEPSPMAKVVDCRSALSRNVSPWAEAVVALCRGPCVVNHTGNPTVSIFHS